MVSNPHSNLFNIFSLIIILNLLQFSQVSYFFCAKKFSLSFQPTLHLETPITVIVDMIYPLIENSLLIIGNHLFFSKLTQTKRDNITFFLMDKFTQKIFDSAQ